MNNFGYIPQGTGFQFNGYNQQGQVPKIDNYLSTEEIQRLMKQENQFSLALSEVDTLRAKCNHRRADGMGDALVEDANGLVRCSICGYEFKPAEIGTTPETIQEAVDTILDFIQTVKLLYIDLPKESGAEYFQIIPLLEKMPKLFELAVKNYTTHNNVNPYNYNNRNMSTMQLFGAISGMLSGQPFVDPNVAPQMNPNMGAAPYGYGMSQQPQYGAPYGMPYGMPQSNGFGYNPATTGYQYTAPQAVPVATEVPQAAPAADTTTVNETFKA